METRMQWAFKENRLTSYGDPTVTARNVGPAYVSGALVHAQLHILRSLECASTCRCAHVNGHEQTHSAHRTSERAQS